MAYPIDYITQEALLAADYNKGLKTTLGAGLKAGEAIDGSTTPQAVADMIENVMWEQNTTTNGTDTRVGYLAVATKKAIKFRVSNAVTANQVKLIMAKVGAPSDNLVVTIETDSSGSPSGTPITNGTSNNLAGSGLKTTAEEQVFSFASAFTLSAGTSYWVVVSRSGVSSITDYYFAYAHSTNFANFSGKRFDGTTWQTSIPMYFEIIPSSGGDSKALYKASASFKQLSYISGFIITNAAQDSTPNFIADGIVPGFTSLTTHEAYYLQNTAGTIGTSMGTISVLVGYSYSATSIRIDRRGRIASGTIADFSITLGTSQSFTFDTVIRVGFKPKEIRVSGNLASTPDTAQSAKGDAFYVLVGSTYTNRGGLLVDSDGVFSSSKLSFWGDINNGFTGGSMGISITEEDENGVTIRLAGSTGGTFGGDLNFTNMKWAVIE